MAAGQQGQDVVPMAVWNLRHGPAPAGSVRVDRGTPWGNPYRIGPDGDRAAVLVKYRDWLRAHPDVVDRARVLLAGRVLACWCAPADCHGHVLARVAAGGQP